MENLAPIVLFVYNRPLHTQKVVEALLKNDEAKYSDLFVFSDAAKNEEAKEKVEQVRNYIKTISGFKSITIKEQAKNQGLAKSIIDGVTEVVNRFGKIIVLEDDIETSPYFLKFMNDALNFYENEKRVWCITGWNHPIDTNKLPNAFFSYTASCWGWGTWTDRWKHFDKNPDKYIEQMSKEDIYKFDYYGTMGMFWQITANKTGELNSWAIFMYAEMFVKKGLCLFPAKSLVRNIGGDGSGNSHGDSTFFGRVVFEKTSFDLSVIPIEENKLYIKRMCNFFVNRKMKVRKNQMFSKIKRVLRRTVSRLEKTVATSYIKNVFNTNFKKRVLISYILEPFQIGIKYSHTNYMECYTAALIFSELAFDVDVINFLDKRNIDYNGYDIVYGFGYPLENAFYSDCAEMIKKIFYGTGSCNFHSNKETCLKVLRFQKEKGKIIPQSGRFTNTFWTLQMLMPDFSISLGNQFVANTYLEINPDLNIRTLPAFYYDCYDINLLQKDFKKSKKHFLWFGSLGLLHKGLDILIDIFCEKNDIFLHICGASKNESKFFDYYQPIIDKSDNIIEHGFLDVRSSDFKEVMNLCAFVLFPSVSEGGCAAVINVMANGGLIPIISTSAGLDVDEYGYIFRNIDKNMILNIIDNVTKLSEEELYAKSLKIKSHVRDVYSYQNYKQNLKEILRKYLEV